MSFAKEWVRVCNRDRFVSCAQRRVVVRGGEYDMRSIRHFETTSRWSTHYLAVMSTTYSSLYNLFANDSFHKLERHFRQIRLLGKKRAMTCIRLTNHQVIAGEFEKWT